MAMVKESRQALGVALALALAVGGVLLLQVLEPAPAAMRELPRSLALASGHARSPGALPGTGNHGTA